MEFIAMHHVYEKYGSSCVSRELLLQMWIQMVNGSSISIPIALKAKEVEKLIIRNHFAAGNLINQSCVKSAFFN